MVDDKVHVRLELDRKIWKEFKDITPRGTTLDKCVEEALSEFVEQRRSKEKKIV